MTLVLEIYSIIISLNLSAGGNPEFSKLTRPIPFDAILQHVFGSYNLLHSLASCHDASSSGLLLACRPKTPTRLLTPLISACAEKALPWKFA